jgi:hypothetical protein
MLDWLVEEKCIAPHVPVKRQSQRGDGTFSRDDCPIGRLFVSCF